MKLLCLVFVLGLLGFGVTRVQSSRRRRGPDKHYRESGGWISSPNYPNLYEKSFTQNYFIKAPDNHKIVLVFHDFLLKGRNRRGRTDVLRVIDGKRTSPVSTKYFEGRIGPFKYTSSTNRLLLIFRSSDKYPKRGFNATFHFINKATHCKFTTLNTNLAKVTSCQNQVDDFATQCKVQCNKDLSGKVSYCVNGKFTNVDCSEYCNVSSFEIYNGSLSSCTRKNGRASQCEVTCDEHFTGGGRAVCKDQAFIVNKCVAKADVVKRCENTNMVVCPYTLNDIMTFYNHKKLKQNKNSNKLSPVTVAPSNVRTVCSFNGGFTALTCPQKLCEKKFINGVQEYPFKCAIFESCIRDFCFYCRRLIKCKRTKASVFG